MGPRSLRPYVCLLVVFTSLYLAAVAQPQRRQQPRNAGARPERAAQAEQLPSETESNPAENAGPAPAAPAASATVTAMTSADLVSQLNQPEANLKGHILVISHKNITGALELGLEQLPIPFRVEFHNCEFQNKVSVSDVVFNQGVVFENVTFDKAFNLDGVHIKGDLLLTNVHMARPENPPPTGKPRTTKIQLNQSQIDGDLRIKNPEADKLEAENLTAGNVIIWLSKGAGPDIDLAKLDTGRLSIAASTAGHVNLLQLGGSTIHETLALKDITFQNLLAPNMAVGKRTQFLTTTNIDKQLDLAFSNLGNFDWEFLGEVPGKAAQSEGPDTAALRLPETVSLEGASFSNLHVAPVFSGKAQTDQARARRWTLRRTDYGLALLEKATYYEPAYTAYESLLKGQGRGDSADAVYFAMRDRRRYTEWKDAATLGSKVIAALNYIVGFGHKWLFGYGRSWVYPIAWCLAFIAAGAFLFRDANLMEKQDEEPVAPFSGLWYSMDLFIPVLSLGVSSRWHPKRDKGFLVFYSKLLSLVGLVFLSAALGALTGTLK